MSASIAAAFLQPGNGGSKERPPTPLCAFPLVKHAVVRLQVERFDIAGVTGLAPGQIRAQQALLAGRFLT